MTQDEEQYTSALCHAERSEASHHAEKRLFANAQSDILKAQEALAQGDLRQPSEKGWGAAAQIAKAVAEKRGWQHQIHAAPL